MFIYQRVPFFYPLKSCFLWVKHQDAGLCDLHVLQISVRRGVPLRGGVGFPAVRTQCRGQLSGPAVTVVEGMENP